MRPPRQLPALAGAAWVGSDPVRPADLRGRIVLVNFWTLTCINWLRQAPFVRSWARNYRDDGLVVIGVHTHEFSFEHDIVLVQQAVQDRALDYPVVVDNDFALWHSFRNNYWPALYYADPHGTIRHHYFGEGNYERLERKLQKMLGVDRPLEGREGAGVEAEADWQHLLSPETYLGAARGSRFVRTDGTGPSDLALADHLPDILPLNHWTSSGDWQAQAEPLVLGQACGRLTFRFHARDAHLVLSAGAAGPIPFHVRVDGEPPGAARGEDVDEEGRGQLRDGRLYHLVRDRDLVRDRTLEVTFLAPGAHAYAFTFG